MKKFQRSESYRKKLKYKQLRQEKKLCVNCGMKYTTNLDDGVCIDCIEVLTGDILKQIENEERRHKK